MAASFSSTVGTAASLVVDGRYGSSNKPVSFIAYVPEGGQVVYLGGSDVSVANGMPIQVGTYVTFDLQGDDIWMVVASSTQDVRVLILGAGSGG